MRPGIGFGFASRWPARLAGIEAECFSEEACAEVVRGGLPAMATAAEGSMRAMQALAKSDGSK